MDISRHSLSYKGVVELCNLLEENPNITSLDVSHNCIGVKGAQILAEITTLRYLNLRFNKIFDEGALAFTDNVNLLSLNVRNNYISVCHIIDLSRNTALISLGLVAESIEEQMAESRCSRQEYDSQNYGTRESKLLIKNAIKRNIELRNMTLRLRVFSSIIMGSNKQFIPLDLVGLIGSFLLPENNVDPIMRHAKQRSLSALSLFRPVITAAEPSAAKAEDVIALVNK